MINESFVAPLQELIRGLARRDYAAVAAISDLSVGELEQAVQQYGRTLVEPPRDALESAEVYPVKGLKAEWMIDVPLHTAEEGRSDLTLTVQASLSNGKPRLRLVDLHVL